MSPGGKQPELNPFFALLVFFDVFLLIVSVAGMVWGGTSERLGVTIVIAATGLSNVVGSLSGRDWLGRRPELMAVEVATLLAFLVLAARSRSFWPLWATGMQLASVATQLAAIGLPASAWQAYAIMQGVWAYPILISLLWGSLRHRRMVALYGKDWVLELWRREEELSEAANDAGPPAPEVGRGSAPGNRK